MKERGEKGVALTDHIERRIEFEESYLTAKRYCEKVRCISRPK